MLALSCVLGKASSDSRRGWRGSVRLHLEDRTCVEWGTPSSFLPAVSLPFEGRASGMGWLPC